MGQGDWDEPLFKIGISLKLKIFGNFWDIVSTQLQEIYHTVQVLSGYFITKFLHIVAVNTLETLCVYYLAFKSDEKPQMS